MSMTYPSNKVTHKTRRGRDILYEVNRGAIKELKSLILESKTPPKLGVFVISYNASIKLEETINRIPIELRDVISEVFVFDDCSSDDTWEVAMKLKDKHLWKDRLKIFQNPRNLGYGGNQKNGYRYAINHDFDYVIMLHGDGQYAPEYIPELFLKAIKEKADVILASRMHSLKQAFQGGMPFYKLIGNRILTFLENQILGLKLTEYHTGYRLYSTKALKQISFELNTDQFHFDSEIIIQLRSIGVNFKEISIQAFYGDETCHVDGIAYAWDIVKCVFLYRMHQLHIIRREQFLKNNIVVYTKKFSPYSSHEKIIDCIKTPGDAIDYGSSSGLLTDRLKAKGVNSTGVDIVPEDLVGVDFDNYLKFDLEYSDDLKLDKKYDYAIFADIIEHLRNAEDLLKNNTKFLKNDGKIIVSTPNIAIWFYRLSLLCGRFNYGDKGTLDRTHVMLYTLDTIKSLIIRSGYVVTNVHCTGLPFEIALESSGRSKLLKFVDRAYYALVCLWPRMFAYQFVVEANLAAVKED